LGFKPHSEAQSEYTYSNTRFNVPCCGRRWGKTQPTGHRTTYKMFIPESYNWIVGPTYKLGEKEFRVVWNDFEKLGLLRHCKKSFNVKQGQMEIRTPWKSVLEVVSAEKQSSLLGEGLSHAVMSEAAQHSRSTWEQYIEPALSDLLGSADFPSTPKGFNWYHALHVLGQGHHKDYRSWSQPTWTNTLRYPGGFENEEIQRIRALVSKVWFDQEYGASFTAISGAIYEEWNDAIHVQPCAYNPNLPNYLAFDYGFINPFVALDIQVAPNDTVYVWREYYGKYQSTMQHGIELRDRDNPRGYNVTAMWGDPRGADEAATLAVILGYVGFMDVPWKLGKEEIKRLLKQKRLVVDPSCTNLTREMPQLHVKPLGRNTQQDLQEQGGDGNIQHKVDDHCCDALRYFVGPHFVMGAGTHLADIYGENYAGSESADMLTSLIGSRPNILDQELSLNRGF